MARYGYGSNPVSAFMQGFAIVDQLETNRQQRAFAEENMSQMRKMWARADEEYEQKQLDRYRAEKLHELDYYLQTISQEVGAQVEQLRQTDPAKADALAKEWFTTKTLKDGKVVGVSKAMNEALKRMQQRDPEFGEHLMLAGGRDPGAGSLVNGRAPVVSVGLVPAGASPTGQDALVAELNRNDGTTGPLTQNRTDSDNDPIDFVNITPQLLFKAFGPGWADNSLAIGRLMQSMWQGPPTGNFRADTTKPDATAQTTAGGGKEQTAPPPQPTGGVSRVEGESFDTADFDPEFRPEPPTDTRNPLLPSSGMTARERGEKIRSDAVRDIKNAGELLTTPNEVIDQIVRPVREARIVLQKTIADWGKKVGGFYGGLLNIGGEEIPAVGKPATTPKEVSEATAAMGGKTSDVSHKGVTENPQRATEVAPAPANNGVAQNMAQSVTQPTRTRRPTIPQLMNAASLAKMGVIDQQSLQRYARTGSWDEPSKKQLVGLGNGQFVIFDPATGGYSVHGTAAQQPAMTDEERFDLSVKYLEGFFTDEDGKIMDGVARRAVRRFDRAGDALANAYNNGQPIPIDQNFANDFAEGMDFVTQYEDPRFILNPSRLFDSREMRDRAGLIGYMAVKGGIRSQEEFNDFGFQYGVEFGEFADNNSLNEEFRADTIINMEQKYQQLRNAGEDVSREEVREATVKAIVEKIQSRAKGNAE